MTRALDALAVDLRRQRGSSGLAQADTCGRKFLDRIQRDLVHGPREQAIEDLFSGLLFLRSISSEREWSAFSRGIAIEHPLCKLIHQDPMTQRSFAKPRGYAGDAPLLDYIYRLNRPTAASGIGMTVYAYSTRRPAAAAVRDRRTFIAEAIDRAADRQDRPIRVLSLACGHLREMHLSQAWSRGTVSELWAFDSDRESLDEVEQSLGHPRGSQLKTLHGSVRRLLARQPDWGTFDLVYSAGLFDYLPERAARGLVGRMFDLLAPGGQLLFTNFLPSVTDAGYMESYMGWELIYRDLTELRELLTDLPQEQVAVSQVFADRHDAIGYVEVSRK